MSTKTTDERLEGVLSQLLLQSRLLEKTVLQEEADPEQWLVYLDKREELLQQLELVIGDARGLPERWRHEFVEPFLEIDRRLIPLMKIKQEQVSNKLTQIKRSKTVNQQYGGYGGTAYGAFFDKKK